MNAKMDFKTWLWGDWGRPNFLTRLGIPAIVTNLLEYLCVPIILYFFLRAYGSGSQIRAVSHNHWYWLAYGAFFITVVTGRYKQTCYKATDSVVGDQFRLLKQQWTDPAIKVFWFSVAIAACGIVVGSLHPPR
jgi:hypothetical protein